jgi:SAM-dependent methyltransferase
VLCSANGELDIGFMSYPEFVAFIGQSNTPPGEKTTVCVWRHFAAINHESEILDLACSTGYSSRVLSEQTGCRAIGIDIVGQAVEVARRDLQHPDRLMYLVGDAAHLPFADGSFTHVIAGSSFGFIKERGLALLIDPAARGRCASLTLGAIGTGPREPILEKIEALALASLAADPSLAGRGEALVARLAALLASAPASKPPPPTRALIDDLA